MPADPKDDALEEALERAVRIIEDADSRGTTPVIESLEENAPEAQPESDE